ncbi:MAG TPA: VTT domain-containing protein [Candidatus Acidoferrales bacterium]|nr:VTT domain-containing protein [Candidatus Acidoferrales bacterium]
MPNALTCLFVSTDSGRRLSHSVLNWLRHLGGPGLILLGVLDNSFVPVPGSMDAFTIILAAGQHEWWPYYAAMATVGSLIGGYLTYRLAQKQGKDQLERRVPRDKMQKVERIFRRWGFGAIVTAALLPPPSPMVPFLVVAGAAQYPRGRFLGALAIGRGVRYTALAFLGAMYGGAVLGFISRHERAIIIGVASAAGIAAFLLFGYRKKKKKRKRKSS